MIYERALAVPFCKASVSQKCPPKPPGTRNPAVGKGHDCLPHFAARHLQHHRSPVPGMVLKHPHGTHQVPPNLDIRCWESGCHSPSNFIQISLFLRATFQDATLCVLRILQRTLARGPTPQHRRAMGQREIYAGHSRFTLLLKSLLKALGVLDTA